MKPTAFCGLIWRSFWKYALSPAAFICAIGFWIFKPDDKMTYAVALPILSVCILLIITLAVAAYSTFQSQRGPLPKVLAGAKHRLGVLCLLEPSNLFSQDTMVSFYYVDEEFERSIGYGFVETIQTGGKIQAVLSMPDEAHKNTVLGLGANNKDILKKIRVKPSIPFAFASQRQMPPLLEAEKESDQ